jgi:hypothetical protein
MPLGEPAGHGQLCSQIGRHGFALFKHQSHADVVRLTSDPVEQSLRTGGKPNDATQSLDIRRAGGDTIRAEGQRSERHRAEKGNQETDSHPGSRYTSGAGDARGILPGLLQPASRARVNAIADYIEHHGARETE